MCVAYGGWRRRCRGALKLNEKNVSTVLAGDCIIDEVFSSDDEQREAWVGEKSAPKPDVNDCVNSPGPS